MTRNDSRAASSNAKNEVEKKFDSPQRTIRNPTALNILMSFATQKPSFDKKAPNKNGWVAKTEVTNLTL